MKKSTIIVIAAFVVIVLGAGVWVLRSRPGSNVYTERAQNLFKLLQTGKYQQFEAEFSPRLRNEKFPEGIAKIWVKHNAEMGPFKESTVLRAEPATDGHNKYLVYLECEFGEKGKQYVTIKYDPAKSIGAFCMGPQPICWR